MDALKGTPLVLGASSTATPEEAAVLAVRNGSCFLFARNEEDDSFSVQTLVMEVHQGEILLLPARDSGSCVLRISGTRDAEVLQLRDSEIQSLANRDEFIEALKKNVLNLRNLDQGMNIDTNATTIICENGVEVETPDGTTFLNVPLTEEVTWLFDKEDPKGTPSVSTSSRPLQVIGQRTFLALDTQGAIKHAGIDSIITGLECQLQDLAAKTMERGNMMFNARARTIARTDENQLNQVIGQISSSISFSEKKEIETTNFGFNNACGKIASEIGSPVNRKIHYNQASPKSFVEQFARSAGVQHRQILLETGWWQKDSGHSVGKIEGTDEYVALIRKPRGYRAFVYSQDGNESEYKVDAKFAATLAPTGELFYPSLPNRALKARDLLKLAFRGSSRDLLITLGATLILSLLNLTTPLVIGAITSTVIPLAERNTMYFLGGALLLAAISTALVGVVSGLAFLRVETRSSFFVLAAFVDRTLKLPSTFFRNTSAGDLTQRVMAIEQIRSKITQSVVAFFVSFVSGFSYIALMFTYDMTLALWGIGLVTGLLLGLAIIGTLLARREFVQSVAKGKLDDTTLDLISGIRQARIQGSLKRVFSRVTLHLGDVARQTYITQLLTTALTVFTRIYPGLATVTIFGIYGFGIISDPTSKISDADFLAFNASLVGFFATTTMIGTTFVTLISIIPMYQRLKPIMLATPEIKEDAIDPGILRGEVEIQDIVFKYGENEPNILDGVTIKANRNECIAIVGATGCGKSTLIKILLGLEKPESGSILFDGIPLENVDASIVRSQLGVVMQANHLTPGNIRGIILGLGTDKPIESAWEAARLVQMDEEIEAMPMGMLTVVNAEAVSGGQAQRLLIARALVGNPRILILDEATSELDDKSQATVTESIMNLGTTRIIIAHRLSTIQTADRIYVLEHGKIVQTGTFDELSNTDGPFQNLVKEQML